MGLGLVAGVGAGSWRWAVSVAALGAAVTAVAADACAAWGAGLLRPVGLAVVIPGAAALAGVAKAVGLGRTAAPVQHPAGPGAWM
jgi:hypothetical protein